jgi:hypothetical protein
MVCTGARRRVRLRRSVNRLAHRLYAVWNQPSSLINKVHLPTTRCRLRQYHCIQPCQVCQAFHKGAAHLRRRCPMSPTRAEIRAKLWRCGHLTAFSPITSAHLTQLPEGALSVKYSACAADCRSLIPVVLSPPEQKVHGAPGRSIGSDPNSARSVGQNCKRPCRGRLKTMVR